MKRPSGWLDPSVSDLSVLSKRYGLDAGRLGEWLAPRLAEYRMQRDVDDTERVPRSEHIESLARLARSLDATLEALDRGVLSGAAVAELDRAAHRRRRELWRQTADRLRTELRAARSCVNAAQAAFEDADPQPGRPSTTRRDALLGELVAWMQSEHTLGFGRACEAAAEILTRCRVQCPADPRDVERLLREKPG
jgi:hypothetical protein